ncbi:MAG: hypothetical protein QXX55_01110 [Candidatus Pacearchaeota archaeon]
MRIKILSKSEKNKILKKLEEQFGIKEINGKVIMLGKERLFLFTGDLDEKQIKIFEDSAQIEKIGIYFAKIIKDEIKLSIEGTQIFASQINKNIIEVNEQQAKEWMSGADLYIKTEKLGFVIIKYGDDFLGCGRASENKIGNFVPKARRLKQKII